MEKVTNVSGKLQAALRSCLYYHSLLQETSDWQSVKEYWNFGVEFCQFDALKYVFLFNYNK